MPALRSRFYLCLRNDDVPASLERLKLYRVLNDRAAAADGFLRVIDESGEDYLYPASWFAPVPMSSSLRRRVRAAA